MAADTAARLRSRTSRRGARARRPGRARELPEPPPDWREYTHLALIPTYTEPLEKLRETVRALAEAEWPKDRKICAIITRETDTDGIANVAALREEFGADFADFIHILDPLEPGIVVGKSSAMAWGGRYLYRLLVRERGMDPRRILVTDLDADYRVHPQYFNYLTWVHLTDPNRETQLYQPIPYFHNNIWEAPMLVRLFAAMLTQLQMWRSVLPEKLQSFGSYSTTLHLVHDVGYWATDAIPEDSRFYWKSFFTYGDTFRAVPLFIPIYGDAVRAKTYWRSMAGQYLQARRWAWGVTDIPYVIQNAIRHTEISLWSRVWRILNLFGEHINWAIAPIVITFGATVPLVLNPAFAQTTLGQNLPLYASTMLSVGLVALGVLIWIEHRIVPPRPADWGPADSLSSATCNGSACRSSGSSSAICPRLTPRRGCSPGATWSTASPRRPEEPMAGTTVPIAPIPLARSSRRLLAGPLILLVAGGVAVAGGVDTGRRELASAWWPPGWWWPRSASTWR